MSALIADVIEDQLTPNAVNSACNAAGKLLRVVELQLRFGRRDRQGREQPLALLSGAAV
jgi:hypothetical protein